ncbi:MAG TPA: DegV family protein [Bacillota bacterium]|nr:DegV family protein [Bacillota bacterium]
MQKIQIVTDSTAYFSKEDADDLDIKVVSLSVHFEGETENEGFPGQFEAYYHKLKSSTEFPTTSQPSIETFEKVFGSALDKGMEVICLVISSALSGTYNSASAAARLTNPEKISIIDSRTSAANLKTLTRLAKDMAVAGMARAEIVDSIEKQKERMSLTLTVDTLEYLKRGGRLTGAQALLGSLLNVKPILELVDGKLIPVAKVRGKVKALNKMVEKVADDVTHITVCHILNEEEAVDIRKRLQERFPKIKIGLDELGPVVGSHLGPKGMGICSMSVIGS